MCSYPASAGPDRALSTCCGRGWQGPGGGQGGKAQEGGWPGLGIGQAQDCREGQGGWALECTYWSATRAVGTGRDLHVQKSESLKKSFFILRRKQVKKKIDK